MIWAEKERGEWWSLLVIEMFVFLCRQELSLVAVEHCYVVQLSSSVVPVPQTVRPSLPGPSIFLIQDWEPPADWAAAQH